MLIPFKMMGIYRNDALALQNLKSLKVNWLSVDRHIKVTDAELQDIIEASVKKMNDVVKANK
jgi:hypothetical protein